MLDQHDVSPFLQADVVPLDVSAAPERQQGQQQQLRSTSSKASKHRTPSVFARMFCCSAPVPYDPEDQHTGELNGPGSLPMQQSLRSHHSWGKVYTHSEKHLQAYPSSEYHDARSNASIASDLTPQHSLECASPSPAGVFEHQQYRGIDQQASVPQELPHWVPPQPLLFAREFFWIH